LLQRLPAPEKTHVLVKEEGGAKGRFSWTNKNSLCHSKRFWNAL